MPSIDKAERRDSKRRKEREGKYQGARYQTVRAGQSLSTFEAERKTTIEGKKPRLPRRRHRTHTENEQLIG